MYFEQPHDKSALWVRDDRFATRGISVLYRKLSIAERSQNNIMHNLVTNC